MKKQANQPQQLSLLDFVMLTPQEFFSQEETIDVISVYNRQDMLEDGVLVDYTELAHGSGIRKDHLVSFSYALHEIVNPTSEEKARDGQSLTGRMHDVIQLFIWNVRRNEEENGILDFNVNFAMRGRKNYRTGMHVEVIRCKGKPEMVDHNGTIAPHLVFGLRDDPNFW